MSIKFIKQLLREHPIPEDLEWGTPHVQELLDEIENKDKEIERLEKRIEKLDELCDIAHISTE